MTIDTETQAKLEQELTVELEGGILRLTINRPESSNSIPYYVRDRLIEQFRAAHSDVSVRCVVLTAAGRGPVERQDHRLLAVLDRLHQGLEPRAHEMGRAADDHVGRALGLRRHRRADA